MAQSSDPQAEGLKEKKLESLGLTKTTVPPELTPTELFRRPRKIHTRPDGMAISISLAIFVAAFLVAFLLRDNKPIVPISVPANQGFGLFAVFYVAAQIVERLTEPVTWALDQLTLTENANKPNRTAVIHSIAILIAALITSFGGLHFLQAVGIGDDNHHLPLGFDSFATALVISGGTKPLHDFISYLQQNKDRASGPLV